MNNIIKKLRKEAGLRQEDLANELGVTRQTIIAIENDKYDPKIKIHLMIKMNQKNPKIQTIQTVQIMI